VNARPVLILGACLLVAAAVAPGAGAAPARDARPARTREPDAVRKLANGLTVAVFVDDRQPLVQIQLLVPAGSAQETAGESGLANLTFQMLGHGTASRTAGVYDDAVQALGGSVGGSVSREFATINGAFLASDMETGLELLADAVVNPLFGEDLLPAIKPQVLSGIVNERGNPATLAEVHLWGAAFGAHRYGRPSLGSPQALKGFTIGEVQSFHRRNYRPDHALLAIAGDVTPERALKAAEEQLGIWGGRAAEAPRDSLPASAGLRIRIVDAPQLGRAELRLGAIGVARSDPDYEALTLAAERLTEAGESGLRAGESGLSQSGLFSVGWSAPVDSVPASLARVREALARAAATPPSETALAAAKTRVTGAYTMQFDTRGGTIAQWMAAVLYPPRSGAPADFRARIDAVAAADVRAALARCMAPERTVLVVLGPAARLESRLKGLGTIEVVPADFAAEVLESPSAARSPATPAQGIRGRSLVNQAVTAHGGLERLRGVRDSRIEGDITMTATGRELSGKMVQVRKDPERFRFETTFSVLKSLQVLDGERGGWSRAGDAPAPIEDLESVSVSGLRSGFRSDVVHLLLAASDPAARVAWRGQERRDDRDVDVVEMVSAAGERRTLFLDVASHKLVATEQNDEGRSVRRIYRDLRDSGGVQWPFQEERFLDGRRAVLLNLTKVTLNTGIADAAFLKPGTAAATPQRPAQRPRAR
jgi:zinc protease